MDDDNIPDEVVAMLLKVAFYAFIVQLIALIFLFYITGHTDYQTESNSKKIQYQEIDR